MRNMAFSSLATSLTMSFCNEMTGRFESYMGGTRWEGHPLPTAGCPTYFQTVQSRDVLPSGRKRHYCYDILVSFNAPV